MYPTRRLVGPSAVAAESPALHLHGGVHGLHLCGGHRDRGAGRGEGRGEEAHHWGYNTSAPVIYS